MLSPSKHGVGFFNGLLEGGGQAAARPCAALTAVAVLWQWSNMQWLSRNIGK